MTLLDDAPWSGRLFDGQWREGSAAPAPVVEPATGETLATTGIAEVGDVARSAALAEQAQRDWASRTPRDRATVLRKAARLWEENAAEIQDWLIREAGSVRAKATIETTMAAEICHDAAALASAPSGDVLGSEQPRWSFSRRVPVGVVAVIAPFNFPLILAIRAVAPALALGNAVLLKPDTRTAVSGGVTLARVFAEAGLPPGLLQVLPGDAQVGAALVEAPQVGAIAFTGSTGAGRAVGAAAGATLKRVNLELGGNNAIVVLPGADVERAAASGALGSFSHQGQICMATGRHLIHESIVDDYAKRLADAANSLRIGDPARDDVQIGPIIDSAQLDHIEDLVSRSVAAGAKVLAGGKADPPYYPPTVLVGVDADTPVWREEVFGPVAPIRAFSDLDEAIEIVNNCEHGLSVGVLGDVAMAMRVADRLHSGKIHINEHTVQDEPHAPFGGVGDSGNGSRIGGAAANLAAFTETQWITVRKEMP